MTRKPNAKTAATLLTKKMAEMGFSLKRSQALEVIAALEGYKSWNEMSAALKQEKASPSSSVATADLITMLEALVMSADDTGCSDDLTVVSAQAVEQLSDALYELRSGAKSTDSDKATITWSVDDVFAVRPDLTVEEARTVLWLATSKCYDAEQGVNWDVISNHAYDLVPKASRRVLGTMVVDGTSEVIGDVVMAAGTGILYRNSTGPDLPRNGVFIANGDDTKVPVEDRVAFHGDALGLHEYLVALQEKGLRWQDSLPNHSVETNDGISAFCIEMTSDVFGSELFKYESDAQRLEGMKRLSANIEELKDGIARTIRFDEMDEDGNFVGNVEDAAAWNGTSWDYNEYLDDLSE